MLCLLWSKNLWFGRSSHEERGLKFTLAVELDDGLLVAPRMRSVD